MFHTKIEVDKHVENCLRKLNNEAERNSRCYAFAKLYFKVSEYEQARRYVSMYLNSKPSSSEAQLLLGKTLEKLGKMDQALEAYRTSLQLDPKQNSLVIKICEILASDNMYFDKVGARYYCEKAQKIDPHNPAVFSLKERLVSTDSKDPSDVTQLLIKELETRPTDVNIRIRLLKHLMQHNQVKEAYKHASQIEQKDLSVFSGNITWYTTIAEVLVKYQDAVSTKNLKWDFWFLLVSSLDKVAVLSLDEHISNISDCYKYVVAVFNFDQTLKNASKYVHDCPEKQLVQEFLLHYRGQLCFHLATLLYKHAKKELIPYKEATTYCLPLLFSAYHTQPIDLHSLWLDHSSEDYRKLVQRWHKEASFRCSQAGHILLAAAKDRKSIVLEKATQAITGMWREQIYKKVFVTREQQSQIKSSYFTTCSELTDILIRLPEIASLHKYDEAALYVYPSSLHHYIWLGLNTPLYQMKSPVFDGLQYSNKNLNNCGAETLNVLDIQSFIYCSIMCAQSQIEDSKYTYNVNANKPTVLPVSITDQLGTIKQAKWLSAAYQMYKNEPSANYNDVRLILIKGIEVVRCIGNHGLDVKVLVALANTFAEKAKTLTKQTEIEFNEARAELYWKAALPLLEKLKNNQAVTYTSNRLFEYKSKEFSNSEVLYQIDSGKLFNAVQLMKKKEYERALKIFEQLKDPYASFYQAQIFKSLADEQTNQSRENVTSEMRSQNIILLSKVRDYLYLTSDRMRDPAVDRNHYLNTVLGTEIEKIERQLSRIDPDMSRQNNCDGISDESASGNSTPENAANYTLPNQSFLNGVMMTPRQDLHSSFKPIDMSKSQFMFESPHNVSSHRLEHSFRREARPSPERLDAQLRQLAASKDVLLTNILEQNKAIIEAHKTMVDELKSVKEGITSLISSANEHRALTDMVYELKKEIKDLKKSSKKSNLLSDEDLFGLDDEEVNDFNINANPVSMNPANLYSNFQGRLQGTNNLAYPPLPYGTMYPMYTYPGLGLPTPGTLPFADPAAQMADFRVGAAFPQAFPQVPQQSNYVQNLPPVNPQVLGQPISNTNIGQATCLQGPSLTSFKEPTTGILSNPLPVQPTMPITTTTPSSKAAPHNVVITASDPLPSTNITSTQQQILSVTIPPQHLKGNIPKPQPHNYQIALPTTSASITTPSVLNQSPMPITTQSILSNVAPPIYSAIADKSPNKNIGLGLQIEKKLSESFSNNLDNSNASNNSVEDHDPCPDFKPIIPLPDEVAVSTGEENEQVLFCERATLFRYTDKEWKERGVGELKILKNLDSGKVRLLMRRDQVHKICANHFLSADMELQTMKNSERAFIWAANDFADEKVVLEKLCVRFKKVEEAQKFKVAFDNAKMEAPVSPSKSENAKITAPVKEATKPIPFNINVTSTPVKPAEVKPVSTASMGGFVFTSTPTFQFKKDEETPVKTPVPTEQAKPSPFASFSFSASKTTTATIANMFQTPTKVENPFAAKADSTTTVDNSSKTSEKPMDGEDPDDFVPNAVFKPVIPLPALVDIKTGEENCEVMFEHKAKLLRFDSELKEWKERGLGIMKILKDQNIRFVMRREQVLKVCCNHQLLKAMEFTKMATNPKAVTWAAKDFSEGEFVNEMFAIRFKTEETTNSFLETIDKAKGMLNDNNLVDGVASQADSNKASVEVKGDKKSKSVKTEPVVTPPPKANWGEKFKPKHGSWECKNCYIVNDGKDMHCVACETPKNDTAQKKSDVASSSATTDFSFGVNKTTANPTWGEAFKPKAGSWECKMCYIRNNGDLLYCASCESPKDDTVPAKDSNKGVSLDTGGLTFSFGMPAAQPAKVEAAKVTFNLPEGTTVTPSFSFGKPASIQPEKPTPVALGKSTFSFKLNASVPEAKEEVKPVDMSKNQFVFGSPQKHDFEFTPKSPRQHHTSHGDDESDGSYVEEEEDTIYFKPVIPLPDKIEVKTGEEEEEVLYCHRAKLFRFNQGEWKERGIGDIKILRMPSNKKLRVLMRREKILKICLNHALTKDVEYSKKDEKTWMFSAPDFSEGEISYDQFCLRFKTVEIAADFKKAINNALGDTSGPVMVETGKTNVQSSDSEVEFVSETQVSSQEIEEAKKLMLPPKFMAYRQLSDCTCDQCKKEDELLKVTNVPAGLTSIKSPTSSWFSSPSTNNTSFNASSSLFGTPFKTAENTSLFNTPTEGHLLLKNLLNTSADPNSASKNDSVKASFTFSLDNKVGSDSITSTELPKNIFGSPQVTVDTTKNLFGMPQTEPTKNIFGAMPAEPTKNLFGAAQTEPIKNLFGAAQTEPVKNIFGTPKPEPPKNLFGSQVSNPTSGGSIFGTPSIFGSGQTQSIFGSNNPTTNIFGGANPATPVFGASTFNAPTTTASLFTSTTNIATPSFGSIAAKNEETIKPTDDVVLKCDSSLSFASLAANTTFDSTPTFATPKANEKNPFGFLGAGTPIFGGAAKAAVKANESAEKHEDNDNEDGGAGGDDYDPHYEPIVPLPDAIVVTTGEEDETVLFNERAKVFRYVTETKEWKERGVGQFKILHHKEKGTYRFLLRREQVHKIVLNMLLNPQTAINPLMTSQTSFCWTGYNFIEDPAMEQLAVKFKNEEIAQRFLKCSEDVIDKLQQLQEEKDKSNLPSILDNYGAGDAPENEEEEEEDEEDEDDYQNEDDDRSIMFSSRCALSIQVEDTDEWFPIMLEGDMKVYYDPDFYGACIIASDDNGLLISKTIIGMNTVMNVNDQECTWRAVEWANEEFQWKNFRATFDSYEVAESFHLSYEEGFQYAEQCDIIDEIPGLSGEVRED